MKKLLRPIFRWCSNAYGAAARLTHPWLPLPALRMTIMVTARCNLACPYCYLREELKEEEPDRLTADEWLRVVDSIPRYMLVMVTGGEPFIAPDIMTILGRLFERKRLVSIVTNGTALGGGRIERLVDGRLRYLMCSLDGMSEYHNRVTGRDDTFERLETAPRTLREVKARKGAAYPLTCIKTTVTESNYDEIPKLLEFAEKELKVDHFALSLMVDNPLQEGLKITGDLDDERFASGNAYRYPESVRPHVRRMIGRVFEYRRTSRMQIEFAPMLGGRQRLLEYVDDPAAFRVRRCSIPWIEFTLYPDGDVTPCVTYHVANIRDLDCNVRKVIRHPRYREFLKTYGRRMPGAPPCEGCCWGRHVRKQ